METIIFKKKEFQIVNKYKDNKLHVKYKNKDYVIVPFNTYNDYSVYLKNKKVLKKNKLEMSKILKKDLKGLMLLEQFISGVVATSLIANNELEKKHYTDLFRIYRNNRFAKIAINYRPNNFVFHNKNFYYVSDEVYKIKEVIPFEQSDDIFLWMNTKYSQKYCIDNDYAYKARDLIPEGAHLKKELALLCVTYW